MAKLSRERDLCPTDALPTPEGIEARCFKIENDSYVLFEFAMPSVELPGELSCAERDVAQRTLDGQSLAEIACARRTSVHTVTNQLRAIYAKLRVSSRTELVRACRTKS